MIANLREDKEKRNKQAMTGNNTMLPRNNTVKEKKSSECET